jgi:ATP phosphoribosyltransferase regulatory subunit
MSMLNEKLKILNTNQQKIDTITAFFNAQSFTYIEPELLTKTSDFIKKNPSVSEEKLVQLSLRDGFNYVLRPDITTMILQSFLPLMSNNETLQVYYRASSYRQSSKGLKKYDQLGYEIIGNVDISEEIKRLSQLSDLFSKPLRLIIGYPSIINQFISFHPLSNTIKQAIKTKSLTALKQLLDERTYDEMLPFFDDNALIKDDRLSILYALKNIFDFELDLSLMPQYDYYTGIYIVGYMEGYPQPVLFGGAYDQRTQRFDKEMQAFGISMSLDMVFKELKS